MSALCVEKCLLQAQFLEKQDRFIHAWKKTLDPIK